MCEGQVREHLQTVERRLHLQVIESFPFREKSSIQKSFFALEPPDVQILFPWKSSKDFKI